MPVGNCLALCTLDRVNELACMRAPCLLQPACSCWPPRTHGAWWHGGRGKHESVRSVCPGFKKSWHALVESRRSLLPAQQRFPVTHSSSGALACFKHSHVALIPRQAGTRLYNTTHVNGLHLHINGSPQGQPVTWVSVLASEPLGTSAPARVPPAYYTVSTCLRCMQRSPRQPECNTGLYTVTHAPLSAAQPRWPSSQQRPQLVLFPPRSVSPCSAPPTPRTPPPGGAPPGRLCPPRRPAAAPRAPPPRASPTPRTRPRATRRRHGRRRRAPGAPLTPSA
jgi:hypothetical protein